jgi:acyl dehydratase
VRAAHTTLRYDEVGVGDELPVLEVPITATAIVAGAIASRDYQDVHHDRELAKLRGSPDIFMNILTTNGYVGRFVTDWAGPEVQLRVVDIVLGAPNYPGDVMRMSGRVTSKQAGVITLEVRGANRLGDHVKGSVELSLPGGSGAR